MTSRAPLRHARVKQAEFGPGLKIHLTKIEAENSLYSPFISLVHTAHVNESLFRTPPLIKKTKTTSGECTLCLCMFHFTSLNRLKVLVGAMLSH